MVQIDLYTICFKNQILRILIALAIIIPCDILFLRLSEGNCNKLRKHFFAYLNVWVTLAIVFSISVLEDNKAQNYILYGILIGLLIYVPLYNWLISYKSITGSSLTNLCFGIILSSFTCLIVFLISEKANLLS